MLEKVKTSKKHFSDYKKFLSRREYKAILDLSRNISAKRVVVINSTAYGGGVAEILHSLIPLFNSLKIKTVWYTFEAPIEFFEITKKIHNSLQGSRHKLNKKERSYYLRVNKKLAQKIDQLRGDILVIHDPQPLASVFYLSKHKLTKKILRLHVDLSQPNKNTFNFLNQHIHAFNKIILSSFDYINQNLDYDKILTFCPAIDPLSLKNKKITKTRARRILREVGIELKKPALNHLKCYPKDIG